MRTQAIEVQQDRRGRVIVAPTRRRISPTAWLLLAPPRLLIWTARRVARGGWHGRWHLTPLAGGAWVTAYGTAAPLATVTALTLAGTLTTVWARRGSKVGAHMVLSALERAYLAEGLFGAALWVAGEWGAAAAGYRTPAILDIGAYAALTGHAAGRWWWSRRPAWMRREPRDARLYTGQWDDVAGEATHLGESYVRKDTVELLRGEDVTFHARLGPGHHAEDVGENERRAVERLIKGPGGADLPPGSVALARLPHTVNEITVTISPRRASLTEPIEWPGVQPIPENGKTVTSREPSGRPIEVTQFSPTGARNVTMTGSADAGKTSTLRTFGLRGPATLNDRGQPIETILALDGGKGNSAPEMAPAFLIHAIQPSWWPVVFDAWCAILDGREARRGDPRNAKSSWRTWQEEDPIMTLLMMETPAITRALPSRCDRQFAEGLQRIRKSGMRVILDTQEITRGNIPGGNDIETVRNQLFGNGTVLAHRIGTDDKRALQSSHDAGQLTRQQNSLPAGGGWHIAIEQGQLLSARTRSLWAPPEQTLAEAQRITPRPLAGPDLEAAMRVPGFKELYEHRDDPLWTPGPAEEAEPDTALVSGPRPFQPARPADTAKDRALRVIRERYAQVGDEKPPHDKEELCEKAGISAGSWHNVRRELLAEGLIQPSKKWPGKYIPAFPKGAGS